MEKVLFIIFGVVITIWQYKALTGPDGSKVGCVIFVILALVFTFWAIS